MVIFPLKIVDFPMKNGGFSHWETHVEGMAGGLAPLRNAGQVGEQSRKGPAYTVAGRDFADDAHRFFSKIPSGEP